MCSSDLLSEYDFIIGKAAYISDPGGFVWHRIRESSAAVDSVLSLEKQLTDTFSASRKFAFEKRNGKTIKQYSSSFTKRYSTMLHGMVERRMRQSIFAVASFWYTAWIDAGQPDLTSIIVEKETEEEKQNIEWLNRIWKSGTQMIGREE